MKQAPGVTCPSCRVWIDDTARLRRCPRCGEDLDTAPRPDLPEGLEEPDALQGPAFESQDQPNDTAPMSEFIAAGAVVAGIAMLIIGATVSSGVVALAGVILAFMVLLSYSLFKGAFGRAMLHYKATLWTGRHPDEAAASDRERERRSGDTTGIRDDTRP
jgi:hypothetical protein